jgi:hypothetical protein
LSAEIAALIDEYGEDALATELVNDKASEALIERLGAKEPAENALR